MTLVVDASAVVELVLGRPAGEAVAEQFRVHGFDLHAPHLLDVEVASALRRIVATGDAPAERGRQAVADLLDLPVERYPHHPLIPRVWALRGSFSSYDAVYVALAEVVSEDAAPLLTADARLARTARAHTDLAVLLAR